MAKWREKCCVFLSVLQSLLVFASAEVHNNETLRDSVMAGIKMALTECQFQVRWTRWGCADRSPDQVLSNPRHADRETAMVQALVTAGIVHTVAKHCTTGQLPSCTCSPMPPPRDGVRWEGCKDAYVPQGEKVARAALAGTMTSSGHGGRSHALVHLHNFDIGRQAVTREVRNWCRCVGLTGSCARRVCWHYLRDFHEVGDYLRDRYSSARRVTLHGRRLRLHVRGSYWKHRKPPRAPSDELVYLEESRDYCKPVRDGDRVTGGTLGRVCSRPPPGVPTTFMEEFSCQRLCDACGYKVGKRKVQIQVDKCNCKFQWCCSLQCDLNCTMSVDTYYCRR